MTRRLARALLGSLLILCAGLAVAAPQMVLPVPGVAAKGTASAVRFNIAKLYSLQPGDTVLLSLPSGRQHEYIFEQVISHGGGFDTWIGRHALTGDNQRAIVTTGPGGSVGTVQSADGDYRILNGDGHDWISLNPPVNLAPRNGGSDAIPARDDEPSVSLVKGIPTYVPAYAIPKVFGFAKAAPTPVVRVDVMVLYTKDIAAKLGLGTLTMIYNLIAITNQVLVDSEIAISLRLVNATMIDYDNSHGSGFTLSAMSNVTSNSQRSFFENLTWGTTSLRNTVGADIVAVVRDGPIDTGGVAYQLSNPIAGTVTRTNAYSVNNYCVRDCASTFAHELGHNMGNAHDRATTARDFFTDNPTRTLPTLFGVFSYSNGHYDCANGLTCNPFVPGGCPSTYAQCLNTPVDANRFGTLMAYVQPQVRKFSNPSLTCVPSGGSAPTARSCGSAGVNDNALSMNNVRQNVAAYRNETLASLPGSVQFTAITYSSLEASGSITFTVSRASGSSGAISVNYTVAGATATAGIDFALANGTLTWADGDSANKTFTATINNDALAEGNESFTVTLSNPTGAAGVYLGYPSTATGYIVEPWPPGGTIPSGFTQPASGSSVAWAIASDFSADGDNVSLKSGAINFATRNCTSSGGTAIPCPSILEYSGAFGAGAVSFSYQVSSFQNDGFFEFLVDGTVVLRDSGAPSTKFFSTPITAGNHTLQWRYRPTLSFACAAGGPPPPPGACADRAWIDGVTLPGSIATPTVALTSSANPTAPGQSVTFTATLAGAAGTPTGTVLFSDGTTTLSGCSAQNLSGGVATCSTTALASGTRSITAVYSGSSGYSAGTSAAFTQVVTSGAQLFTANASTLAFGGQSMNTTAPAMSTTLTNTTATPIVVTVAASAGYAIASNTCATVAANGTCQISVTFTPGTQGSVPGVVTLSYTGGGPTVVTLTGTGERSLVTHYYRSILRRAPDSGGKTYWEAESARVQALGANVNEVWFALAQQFYFSTEYVAQNRDATGFVTDLYNTFFNRGPDTVGRDYWVGLIGQGLPREVVLLGFMFSTEFTSFTQAIFGSTAVRREIDTVGDFYRGLLARLPDDAGFNYWVGQFRTAQCQGAGQVNTQVEAISRAYASSAEYTGRNRSNTQYVSDLYNSFLRRAGDLPGVQFWISQIATGARTRENVRQQFIATPEFQARVAAIIAEGCRT